MEEVRRYSVFETPLGLCGIAWSPRGVVRVQLPESNRQELEKKLAPAVEGEPPVHVVDAIRQIQAYLQGKPQSFKQVRLDLDGVPPFHRAVYTQALDVPAGQVCSYKELAEAMGRATAARAVGQAMARNPFPIIVPCHRIVSHNGNGGFSAYGGMATKERLLRVEGATLPGPRRRTLVPEVSPRCLWEEGAREAAVTWLSKRDRRLARVMSEVGACTLGPEHEGRPFAALAESILYQQLAGKAAATIVGRFRALCPARPFPTAQDVLGMNEEQLRSAGISRAKIASLRALSQAVAEKRLPIDDLSAMSDDEVRAALVPLRGIGNWTVDMFLIFHLGRTDVFPPGDLGIRKAIERLYGLASVPSPQQMEEISQRWKPFRTVATWYLWRSLGTVTLGSPTSPVPRGR